MDRTSLVEQLEQLKCLDQAAEALQGGTSKVYDALGDAGQPVANTLNGVWLGHALHPVLTDIPIGAWTTAAVLDLLDLYDPKADYGKSADAAIILGLFGALGAAVSGLTDWYQLSEKPEKRIGSAHALLNISATGLYTISWLLRRNKARTAGRIVSFVGATVVTAAAYLGGDLTSRLKIGTDHADHTPIKPKFISLIPTDDLPEGSMKTIEVDGVNVLLVKQNGVVHALGNSCSHLAGPLSEGQLESGCVRCPWHGSAFSVIDGSVVDGPATFPQPTYKIRIRAGMIEISS